MFSLKTKSGCSIIDGINTYIIKRIKIFLSILGLLLAKLALPPP